MMETLEGELCIPHLLNSSCRKNPGSILELNLANVLLALLSTFIAALNLLVIISISHFRQLHTTTNLILLSLAISDFLIGLVVIPIFATIWKLCWYFGEILCGLVYFGPVTAIMSSVGTVVLISVDRYVAICDPMHYSTRMTEKVVNLSIAVCWLYGFLFAFSLYLEYIINGHKYIVCQGECVTLPSSKEVNFVMAVVIPIITIIYLYSKVFITAANQARAIRSNVTTVTSKTTRKSEFKAARNLGVVVLVYFLCYTPYYFIVFLATDMFIFGVPSELVAIYLFFTNSLINPLIYALLYPWFRKALLLIITFQIFRPGSSDLKFL